MLYYSYRSTLEVGVYRLIYISIAKERLVMSLSEDPWQMEMTFSAKEKQTRSPPPGHFNCADATRPETTATPFLCSCLAPALAQQG